MIIFYGHSDDTIIWEVIPHEKRVGDSIDCFSHTFQKFQVSNPKTGEKMDWPTHIELKHAYSMELSIDCPGGSVVTHIGEDGCAT